MGKSTTDQRLTLPRMGANVANFNQVARVRFGRPKERKNTMASKIFGRFLPVLVAFAVALPVSAQWTDSSGTALLTNTAGNVGIGTTSPLAKVHVAAAPASMLFQHTGVLRTNNSVAGIVSFTDSAGTEYAWFGDGSGSVNMMSLFAGTTHGLSIYSGGVNVIQIPVSGNVGIGILEPTAKLHVAGNIVATGSVAATYQDVAEWVPSREELEPGTVVVIDSSASNHVHPSSRSYDTAVAGVVSAQPGLILGVGSDDKSKIATFGRVKVKVDATNAPIAIGDLLVSSDKAGVAMKSEPMTMNGRAFHQPGTIIGKALEPLENGQGEILVLLSLQ